LVFALLFRSRQVGEGYGDVTLADYDLPDEALGDLALVLLREFGAAIIEGVGLMADLIGGEKSPILERSAVYHPHISTMHAEPRSL
jgi:hypothetical protein